MADDHAATTALIAAYNKKEDLPELVEETMHGFVQPVPEGLTPVRGYEFGKNGVDYHALLQSYKTCGFQATNFGLAVEQIIQMLKARGEPVPEAKSKPEGLKNGDRPITNCTIFLGYTSNMISCGVRETLHYLVKNNMVDVIVTTAGGIEEDFMKCLTPFFLGDFALSGHTLKNQGMNRTGNLLVPNYNYAKFEEWIMPIMDQMLLEQKTQGTIWSPSKMIARLGKEIDNPDSVYYWAYKNNIPVLCPAITDGSLGDMMYMQSYQNPGLIMDIAQDIRKMNDQSVRAVHSGIIILGGGLIKHHICNANLMRDGADYSVFVNTAQEFDGSDAGARPDEAVSWGKISVTAKPVKVYGDASLIFPLLVAETFAREYKVPPVFCEGSKPDLDIKERK